MRIARQDGIFGGVRVRWIPRWANGPGVYYLIKNGRTIYIGVATKFMRRFQEHVEKRALTGRWVDFDEAAIVRLHPDLANNDEVLTVIESILVKTYCPDDNPTSNVEAPFTDIEEELYMTVMEMLGVGEVQAAFFYSPWRRKRLQRARRIRLRRRGQQPVLRVIRGGIDAYMP